MPPRRWPLRVRDILDSIKAIREYAAGMDYPAFAADRKTVDAVVRRFAVMGEAAGGIPPEMIEAHPEIPWRDMRDMRNVVIHAYFGINKQLLWKTISNDLSPLIPLLERLLESEC